MAKGSAALAGLTASLGSGTCVLNSTTVSATYTWYYCSDVTTSAAPVITITSTTNSQTLYIDGVELDQASTPSAFRPGSTSLQGSLVINGSTLQAANSTYALTVNELQNNQASGGGGLFIQGNSDSLFQNALVVDQLNGNTQFAVNTTTSETIITGGSGPSGWNTPALSVSTADGTATALQVANNNLTTGNAASISSTSANQTAGSLLNVSDTATLSTSNGSVSGNLVNVSRSVTSNVTGSGTGTPTLDSSATFDTYPAATTQTDSFTVNAGYSNYYMVIGVFDDLGATSAPTVTYAGVTASVLSSGGIGTGSTGFYLYGLTAPAIGQNQLIINGGSNSGEWAVAVEDYYNVNQTTPIGTVPTPTEGNTNPASITVPTVSGDVVTDFLADTSPPDSPGTGQTLADDSGSLTMTYGPGEVAQSYKQATGTITTMQWTNAYWWALAAVDLKGAAASTESVTSPVATISNSCTTTAGTCTDGTNVLQLSQNYSNSTGAVLNIQNAGSGNMISATGSSTAFQIQPNGSLVISDSLDKPTTAIRLRAISTGDNIESGGQDLWLSGWSNANFTGSQLFFARGNLGTGDLFIGNAQLNGTSNAISGSEGAALLVLDSTANSSADSGDPANAFNGAMYYNSYTNEFRCYQNSEWRNCVSAVQSWNMNGAAATGTTSSTTYSNYPGTSSISFTKAASSTKLVVSINVDPWKSSTSTGMVDIAVNIAGTDYFCTKFFFNSQNVHEQVACSVIVTGISAGAQTAQIQWRMDPGSSGCTFNADNDTWTTMTIQETD